MTDDPCMPQALSFDEVWLKEQGLALRRLALRLLGDEHDAEDAVQDAWLAAARAPTRDGVREPRRWLATITRRAAGHIRRRARRGYERERRAARGPALDGRDACA